MVNDLMTEFPAFDNEWGSRWQRDHNYLTVVAIEAVIVSFRRTLAADHLPLQQRRRQGPLQQLEASQLRRRQLQIHERAFPVCAIPFAVLRDGVNADKASMQTTSTITRHSYYRSRSRISCRAGSVGSFSLGMILALRLIEYRGSEIYTIRCPVVLSTALSNWYNTWRNADSGSEAETDSTYAIRDAIIKKWPSFLIPASGDPTAGSYRLSSSLMVWSCARICLNECTSSCEDKA